MPKKISDEDKRLAQVIQNIGAADRPNSRSRGNRYNDYVNKRTWLIDTSETSADRKETNREVAKLDKTMSWASRSSGGIAKAGGRFVGKIWKEY